MKKIIIILTALVIISGCGNIEKTPRAKHVILIGLDGLGAYDLQRARTPNFNMMAANGALSVKTRCVLESSSSQNWMSMLTGALPIQHGVTSNEWEPGLHDINPVLMNKKGLFPSVFDDIKAQKPSGLVYMFYEWQGLGRMFDLSVPDSVVNLSTGEKVINEGFRAFLSDKPEFLFIAVDETDHIGHVYGHESAEYYRCVSKYDSIIGSFCVKLKDEGFLDNTVIIVTADHGGIEKGHGGTSPEEMQIPVLMYGGGVTRGKVMEQACIIPDIAATVAGLLGVKLPRECAGKFIAEAFEPATGAEYSPLPLIVPGPGFYSDSIEVTLSADSPDARIFYTTDGSAADATSIPYIKPFILDRSSVVKAVTVRGTTLSEQAETPFRIRGSSDRQGVQYRLVSSYNSTMVPDMEKTGNSDRQGLVWEFSLDLPGLADQDHFAVEFSSSFDAYSAGKYSFELTSDDGSKLYIDGKLLIDNDGSHGRITKYGATDLDRGTHAVRIDYFDDYGSEFLMLRWRTPGGNWEIVPFSRLKQ